VNREASYIINAVKRLITSIIGIYKDVVDIKALDVIFSQTRCSNSEYGMNIE
jgi:hypothetical protein